MVKYYDIIWIREGYLHMAALRKIMIVDDEKYERILIEKNVDWNRHGFAISASVDSAAKALVQAEVNCPDLIFCDIRMPGIDGLQLCRLLKEKMPDAKLVILTGYREISYAQTAIRIGVNDFLLKPVRSEELLSTALRLLKADKAEESAEAASTDRNGNSTVDEALHFIQDHLSDPSLSLRLIADSLYINDSYLSRLFRQTTGQTISSYINQIRMEQAKKLLMATPLHTYEIAEAVGIPNTHSFSIRYREYTGMSTTRYRGTMK